MGCFLVLLMACFSVARAQESRTLNVGPLLFTTNEALTDDDITWPRDRPDVNDNRIQMLEANSIFIGVRRTWTDATGVTRDIQIAQIGRRKFSDIELVTPPVSGAFRRTYRTP